MADIFISYASEDEESVGPLAQALDRQGWSVFWDRRIPPGQTWRQYIGTQLDQSRCVLVLWSRHSITSHWVQEEAEIARQRNLLIPSLLEEVTPPFGFQSIQAADLGKWDGTDEREEFQQLVGAITQILGPSPTEEKRQAQQDEKRRRVEKQEERRRVKEEEDERQRAELEAKEKTELEANQWEEERKKQAAEAKRKAEEEAKREAAGEERRHAMVKEAERKAAERVRQREMLEEAKRKAEEEKAQRAEQKARKKAEVTAKLKTEGPSRRTKVTVLWLGVGVALLLVAVLITWQVQQKAEKERLAELARKEQVRIDEEKQRKAEEKRQAELEAKRKAEEAGARQRAEAEAEQKKQQEIQRLLKEGEHALNRNALTTPRGQNAFDYYQNVLKLDSDNAKAQEGIDLIVDRYIDLADAAMQKNQIERARDFLDRADVVKPGTEKVRLGKQRLVSAIIRMEEAQLMRQTEKERKEEEARQKAMAERTRPGRVFQDKLKDGSLGPKMVVIPAGKFTMGSEKSGADDEKPPHAVEFTKPFAIGKYEVTFEEYERFASATGRNLPDHRGWGRRQRPVIRVSWEDAVAYANWLSKQTGKRYRLPSEAEWEYAARAGSETDYWWGNEVGQGRANCSGCGSEWDDKQTAPVGSFAANPFGVHDTAGNVYEWVQDCWHDNYRGAPSDGTAWEEDDGGDCSRRVFRGGSWYDIAGYMRSAYRFKFYTAYRDFDIGFRLAQDLD